MTVVEKEIDEKEILNIIGKLIEERRAYRTWLLPTFALSFSIPLSTITTKLDGFRHAPLFLKRDLLPLITLGEAIFWLWFVGSLLMLIAFLLLTWGVRVADLLSHYSSMFNIQAGTLYDEEERQRRFQIAFEKFSVENENLKQELIKIRIACGIIVLALSLLFICLLLLYYSFTVGEFPVI